MTDDVLQTPDMSEQSAAAWAEISLRVGDIDKQLQQQTQARRMAIPIRGPRQASGTMPAAGHLVLSLGTPAMGRRWAVRNLSVSDAADVTTAVTGTADVFVGNRIALSPIGWRWHLAALPDTEKFSSDQLAVIPSDHLIVVVNGATPGQVILARAEVLDYPMDLPKAVQSL